MPEYLNCNRSRLVTLKSKSSFFILAILGLLISETVLAGNADPFYEPRSVRMDSLQLLKLSITFIEAGFQRGELDAALKRFSEKYSEHGKAIPRAQIRQKMDRIMRNRDEQALPSTVKGGIYLDPQDIVFSNDRATVSLRTHLYLRSDLQALSDIESNLEFRKVGGSWLLYSSDGLLENMEAAYERIKSANDTDDDGRPIERIKER